MSPPFGSSGDAGMTPRRPKPGLLRRERRALVETRGERLEDVGGLLVEMYRQGEFRRDVLAEKCSAILGIDKRLAEIDDLLQHGRAVPRCECGAPIFRGTHFCPNCGRRRDADESRLSEDTVIAPQTPPSDGR
jgi:hypothetical protein